MERRSQSSVYAKTFLEDQLKATKARLEESERTLNTYAKNNSILTLDEKTSVISQTYTDYSSALGRVEQDRLKAEAQYNAVAANPDSAPQVLESKTVQAYKEQKAKIEGEYLSNLAVYKPEFPKMVQLKAQVTELEARIKKEVASVLASMKGQFEAAKRQEDQVRARLQETRREVLVTQGNRHVAGKRLAASPGVASSPPRGVRARRDEGPLPSRRRRCPPPLAGGPHRRPEPAPRDRRDRPVIRYRGRRRNRGALGRRRPRQG